MQGINPYKAGPGVDTDRWIHKQFFAEDGDVPAYSTDDGAADKVRARIKVLYKCPVQTGETKTHPRKHFARFDTGPSTSTEVLAETRALAICRLAMVIGMRREGAMQ